MTNGPAAASGQDLRALARIVIDDRGELKPAVCTHSAALLFICPYPVMLREDSRFWEGRLSDSQARPVLAAK